MARLLVINAVALTEALLRRHAPGWIERCRLCHLRPDVPAVTCTVQSSILTGSTPEQHGIVGNGWYNRELAEVQFWRQSNHLVRGEKIWQRARRELPGFTCAQMFWWFNMYADVDWSCTPRPCYPADGRKLPDFYSAPPELKDKLARALGPFPLFKFWGPATDITSTRWIAEATGFVMREHRPTLTLCYLPHLDYVLQREGPEGPSVGGHVHELIAEIEKLEAAAHDLGMRVLVLSEYGIAACDKDIALNRLFRGRGWLSVRSELGRELLDPGASRVFAVADHQIAHIYLNDPGLRDEVAGLLCAQSGVGEVYVGAERARIGLDSARAGDIVALARRGSWFSYYYWDDDRRAPDFARTVDIHRKPGYDPAELFLDPDLAWPKLAIARHILKVRLGLRSLLEVIPTHGTLVRGTHGRGDLAPAEGPVVLVEKDIPGTGEGSLDPRGVHALILEILKS